MNSQNNYGQIEGLVLSVQEYKEKDGIIKVLTPDAICSVYARGIQKETSKNKRLCNPFSKVMLEYDPKYSRDMLFLIHGDVQAYYYKINEDLLVQAVCFVLRDLMGQRSSSYALYEFLEKCWQSFHEGRAEDGYLYAVMIMKMLLAQDGFLPYVDGCISCSGTSHIETLSIAQGGFLCRQCRKAQEQESIMPKELLRKYRALFKAGPAHYDYLKESFAWDVKDVLYVCSWFVYHQEYKIPSISFLETVCKMHDA